MNLIINNKLKSFLIFIFSYLYLNFYFLIININFKEDFFNNRTNISYIWPHTINFTNILYFRIATFINNIINNPEQTIIIIGSIALSIYIYIFLKYKNSLYLFINFLVIPITPVFFISINRFAISSALIILSIDYFYNEKQKNLISKLIFFAFQLFSITLHITSILLLILNIKDLEKEKKFLNPNFYILKAHNWDREISKIIFFLFLLFLIFVYSLILDNISLNNYDFTKLNIFTNCLIYDCQLNYSIFLLPISFFLILFNSKKDSKKKYIMLITIFLISFLSFILPLFWRFFMPLFGLLPKFTSKSTITPNLILMFYSIYLFPKYIII